MPDPRSGLIDADVLGRIHRLDIVARRVVDGMHVGIHRSRAHGQSVDFADHRPYVAGDDMRRLDWKVLGRSDRLVIKRYEAETDLSCLMAVDGSASMGFRSDRAPVDKFRYASVLTASLAWLTLQQQDRVGLHVLGTEGPWLEAARADRFRRICDVLENHQPASIADAEHAAQLLGAPAVHRGLVVIVSDLLDDPESWVPALDRLVYRGHDVAMVWLLDPGERDLAVDRVARFEDIEGGIPSVVVDPRSLREAYAAEVAAHRTALQRICRQRGVTLIEALTNEPPHQPLNRLLRLLNTARITA